MSHKSTTWPMALICIILVLLGNVTHSVCAEIGKDAILQVWKKQQESIRSVRFSWSESRTYSKGSLPSHVDEPTPPADVNVQVDHTLCILNDLMQFTYKGPKWDVSCGKFCDRSYISSFDGRDNKVFFDESKDDNDDKNKVHKLGFINKNDYNQDVVDYHLWSILFMCRAIHPSMGQFSKANEWELSLEKGIIDDQSVVILEKKETGITWTCWIDPSREYSILRYIIRSNSLMLQVDISYKLDQDNRWIPSEWTTKKMQPGNLRLRESTSAIVTAFEINPPLAPEDFLLNFPSGTEVVDYKEQINYIARENGDKRIITNEERLRDAQYCDFLSTDTGMAKIPLSHTRHVWLMVIGISLLAIVVLLMIRKRFQSS